ncbi:MAG: hypothetical protein KDA54_05675 [Phycisphaerales bacterium]|nr:hypothetical protein [Phycisphaerales bacterium]
MNCKPITSTAPTARPDLADDLPGSLDDLHAPSEQGECLVAPSASRLSAAVEYNRKLFARYQFEVAGLPFATVRDMVRSRIGGDDVRIDQPFIATGHQPDFFHAGVWAKHIVARRLADAVGGAAFDLIVDHDAPKQHSIAVPTIDDGLAHVVDVAYANAPAEHPFEFISKGSNQQTQQLIERMREAMGDRYDSSLLPEFFNAYQAADGDWVDQALSARKAVEASMGIQLIQRRTSRYWYSPLLAELLLSAESFANTYNQILAGEDPGEDVHEPDRSVATLERINGAIELPLWINHPGEPRHRLFVAKENGKTHLFAETQRVATFDDARIKDWPSFEADLLQLSPWGIRPKALILTMWARLFWADIFIHGIGGAKYDRLTDRLIQCYFGVEPPVMACVSATLRMSLPRTGATEKQIDDATRSLRDINFNPHRYITHKKMAAIQSEKETLIAESQRLRRDDRYNRRERTAVFNRIRELNSLANSLQPNRIAELRQQRDRISRAIAADAIADRRDYFFAMHDRSDLQHLLENLPGVQQMQRSDIV